MDEIYARRERGVTTALVILVLVTTYLVASFVVWDFNPGNWTLNDRSFAVFVALVVNLFIIGGREGWLRT